MVGCCATKHALGSRRLRRIYFLELVFLVPRMCTAVVIRCSFLADSDHECSAISTRFRYSTNGCSYRSADSPLYRTWLLAGLTRQPSVRSSAGSSFAFAFNSGVWESAEPGDFLQSDLCFHLVDPRHGDKARGT